MTQVLKVCFVIDCTGSMKPWLQAAKSKVLQILDDICELNKDFKIFASLIGYRDYGEKMYRIDFTEDHLSLHYMLLNMTASGGKDEAEDVSGAYHWLTSLDWKADVKIAFHITDAPDHGIMYHDHSVSDDHPEGHYLIDLKEEVRILADDGVDLTLFRLNKKTDIMYSIIEEEYSSIREEGFRIVNFVNSKNTADDVFHHEVSTQLASYLKIKD